MLQCGHDPKAVENGSVPHAAPARPMRFNAATTRRPWRTTSIHNSFWYLFIASMRPRPEGRGEHCLFSRSDFDLEQLQCGHDPKAVENKDRRDGVLAAPQGFNAATTRRPWRTSEPSVILHERGRLQRGHDPKAVENYGTS